ncbi:hypothetical protein [Rhabdothermincola salaria]|uniref:hypothetical protein n=1 Tax=Rhabdothermincola salaria TaxID=2903142 RepID=UPI001E5D74FB|nr:hypothetical protein [Rhabdothermincola salaria]MCD9623574.1 hypothetical protein [Rhabdothermincola salaria]
MRSSAPPPPVGRRRRSWRRAGTSAALALAVVVLAGCREDQTGQPGIPDVDFTPHLIVTVDGDALTASVGPRRADDPAVSADPARLPTGSVMELRFAGPGEQRVVGYLTPPGEEPPDLDDPEVATPSPLVDSGIQRAGDEVTVVLTDPGTLELSPLDDLDRSLAIELTPAS